MSYKVAVVGATGNVGREILSILAERDFPHQSVAALASARSANRKISMGDEKELVVQDLAQYDFTGTDIVFSSPGSAVSEQYTPKAVEAGAIVIDNTSKYRMEADVPLVVPEVNPQTLKEARIRGIVANPNCSTIQMVVALKPLHDLARIKRVVASTYQSVSGAGKAAMDELFDQTKGIYANAPVRHKQFTKQIAFNAIPHIDVFMEDGATKEEWKMQVETKKILDPDIDVIAHCVRVPVFVGHGEAVFVECFSPVGLDAAREALRKAPGLSLVDHREDGGYVTQVESAGDDLVYVSRLRTDSTVPHGLAFWVVADNLRKGAALNAVQIAERMIADGLL